MTSRAAVWAAAARERSEPKALFYYAASDARAATAEGLGLVGEVIAAIVNDNGMAFNVGQLDSASGCRMRCAAVGGDFQHWQITHVTGAFGSFMFAGFAWIEVSASG